MNAAQMGKQAAECAMGKSNWMDEGGDRGWGMCWQSGDDNCGQLATRELVPQNGQNGTHKRNGMEAAKRGATG